MYAPRIVANTEGNTSIANFVRYFSMPAKLPVASMRELSGTLRDQLRQIDGKSVNGRLTTLGFQLNFEEYDFRPCFVEHVVLHPRLAKIGFSDRKLGLRALAIGRHDGHLTGGHGNDDIVHLVNVMPRRAAGRQPPFGDP